LKRSAAARDVFAAIADPTRRQILDLLNDRGRLVAGDIANHFAAASRPGISRHLRVLKECGVVTCDREGKARVYSIIPKPLQRVRDGWLARFGTMQSESLKALRARAEAASGD